MRHALSGSLVVVLVAACDPSGMTDRERPFDGIEEHELEPPRRPGETFYVERASSDCVVVVRRGEREIERSAASFACPRILGLGDRIRLAGRSCFHETARGEAPEPTVCPDRLVDAEQAARAVRVSASGASPQPSHAPSASR